VAPVRKEPHVSTVDDRLLDRYVAKRLKMPTGRKEGDTISPETVRKELRTIRTALNKAVEVSRPLPGHARGGRVRQGQAVCD